MASQECNVNLPNYGAAWTIPRGTMVWNATWTGNERYIMHEPVQQNKYCGIVNITEDDLLEAIGITEGGIEVRVTQVDGRIQIMLRSNECVIPTTTGEELHLIPVMEGAQVPQVERTSVSR